MLGYRVATAAFSGEVDSPALLDEASHAGGSLGASPVLSAALPVALPDRRYRESLTSAGPDWSAWLWAGCIWTVTAGR